MSGIGISIGELPAAAPLTGHEVIEIEQGGTSVKVSVSKLLEDVSLRLGGLSVDVSVLKTAPTNHLPLYEQEVPPALEDRFVGMRWLQPSSGLFSIWINNGGNPTWVQD